MPKITQETHAALQLRGLRARMTIYPQMFTMDFSP